MLITQLRLQNFKSYAESTITFQPGTNAIIGANGAGKSTLLEAIGFVLFDYRETGMNLSALLREGSTSGLAVVQINSSYDERDYEVERRFTSKTTTLYRVYDLDLDRQVLAEGQADVLEWLRQHLCADPLANLGALFENTVGVPQGTLTAPFQQSAGPRKAIFDPLLQVDTYQKSSDNLRPTLRYLEEQSNQIQQDIVRMEERLTDLPGLREEGASLEEEIRQLLRKQQTLQADLAEGQELERHLDEAEKRVRDLMAELERVRNDARAHQLILGTAMAEEQESERARVQVEKSLQGYQSYVQADERLKEMEMQRATRDRLWEKRNHLLQEQVRLSAQIEQLQRELQAIAEAAEQLQTLTPLVAEQERLETDLREAEAEVRNLQEARRRIQEAAKELERAQDEVTGLNASLADALALERDLAHVQEQTAELSETVDRLRTQQASAQVEIARLRKQKTSLDEASTARCPVCEAELTPEHRAELLADNAQLTAKLTAQADRLAKELGTREREKAELQRRLQHIQQRLRQLPTETDVRQAEMRLAYRVDVHNQEKTVATALEGAPLRLEAHRQALKALNDPRRTFQRCEDTMRLRPQKEQACAAQEARHQELQCALSGMDQELLPFAQLDAELGAVREIRDRHQAARDLYLAHLGAAQQLETRRSRVQNLEQEGEALRQRVQEIAQQHAEAVAGYDAQRHAQVRQQVAELHVALAGVAVQLQGKQDRLTTVQRSIEQLASVQQSLELRRSALQEAEALRSLVDTVRETLRQAGPLVTQQRVNQISREASLLYGDIMADHSSRLQWAEDYELALEVKGLKRTFRQLSGGEQMSAALALRLALLRGTSQIDVAFFDEPTAHLDPERRDSLADRITQVQGFAQLFVISHDDTFERAVQNHVRIVKDAGGSRPEKA